MSKSPREVLVVSVVRKGRELFFQYQCEGQFILTNRLCAPESASGEWFEVFNSKNAVAWDGHLTTSGPEYPYFELKSRSQHTLYISDFHEGDSVLIYAKPRMAPKPQMRKRLWAEMLGLSYDKNEPNYQE